MDGGRGKRTEPVPDTMLFFHVNPAATLGQVLASRGTEEERTEGQRGGVANLGNVAGAQAGVL